MKLTIVTAACAALMATVAVADVESMRAKLIEAGEFCATAGANELWKIKDVFWQMSRDADVYAARTQLEDLFATVGLDCVNQGASIPYVWVSDEFTYMNVNEYQKYQTKQAEAAAEAAAEAEAKAIQAATEAMERANRLELARRVHTACIELAERDSVAAYTNAICVETFRVTGLPK